MLSIELIGALVVIALINVFAGLVPVTFTGDALLAVRLASIFGGVVTYSLLDQA